MSENRDLADVIEERDRKRAQQSTLRAKVDPDSHDASVAKTFAPKTTTPRRTAPRSRGAGRPAARRTTKRADSGSSDDPEPAPPAAREAVAGAWLEILRRRHPGMSWGVAPGAPRHVR